MKQELVELLEIVCNEVYTEHMKGNEAIEFVSLETKADVTFFFIMAHIKGYLHDIQYENLEQLKADLLRNDTDKAQELSILWDELLSNFNYNIIGIHNTVAGYHLHNQDDVNSLELVRFLLSQRVLLNWSEGNYTQKRLELEAACNLAKELTLSIPQKNILVIDALNDVLSLIIQSFAPVHQYTFVGDNNMSLKLLRFFFEDFKNIRIIEEEFDSIKHTFAQNSFDFIYSGNIKERSLPDIMNFLKPDGWTLCTNQNYPSVKKWERGIIEQFNTPFLFFNDPQETLDVVCVKSSTTQNKICCFDIDYYDEPLNNINDRLNRMFAVYSRHYTEIGYVEITKEDLVFNKKLDFKTLTKIREKGRENYVWKSFDDVFELRTDLENMSFDVDNNCIVTKDTISRNPFDLELSSKFTLCTPSKTDEDFLGKVQNVHSGFELVNDNWGCKYIISRNEAYLKDFNNAFDLDKCEDKEYGQFFAKLLTTRAVTFDSVLRIGNKFRIVHASKEHPIFIQYFRVEQYWDLTDLCSYSLADRIWVYTVNEGYDAKLVIHEIMTSGQDLNGLHPSIYFLVAPDITIQKADYAKKKENYIKDLQRKRAEEEAELARLGVRNAVADLAHMLGTTFARQGSMMNTIRLLKKKGLPVADEKMSSLMDSVNYVMRVIQNFGGDFEHTEFEWQDLNACELLKSYCTEWKNAMGKRFATEVYTNECDGTTIKTDPFYLKIMLDSIFENAWRHGFEKNYTESNKVLIDLKQVSYKGRKYLLLRICNNGKPLSNDIDMDAYTTRGRFSETSGRSGLGGNHVYQIVKKHEGYMSIDGSDPEWPFAIEILLPIFSFNNVDVQLYDKSCL